MNKAVEARRMLRAHRYGTLCTLSKKLDGFPFGSITPYLVDHDGTLILLISALAEHRKNIDHDDRVSLITHNQSTPDVQMQGRITVTGHAHRCKQPSARYLRHFPEAARYLSLSDFAFYRITPLAIRHIAGVGRLHWIKMEDYAITLANAFADEEETLLAHINEQQHACVHQGLLQSHGVTAPDAKTIGCDCDGLDVRRAEQVWRLDFATPLTDPQQAYSLSTQLTQTLHKIG
ncbi:MAG: pyridoxamine 5'-phosphate oxidase family protein [Gallionella sp.]